MKTVEQVFKSCVNNTYKSSVIYMCDDKTRSSMRYSIYDDENDMPISYRLYREIADALVIPHRTNIGFYVFGASVYCIF